MTWNRKYFTGIVLLDIFFISAVLFSPTATAYIIYPLTILAALGVLVFIFKQDKPIKESWVKPIWFPIYDIITDGLFLWACYYVGDITLLFLYAFTTPFKFFIKREPYHDI